MTRNAKTNLIGATLAALVAVQPLITAGTFDIKKHWINLLVAAGIAWLSYYIGKKG